MFIPEREYSRIKAVLPILCVDCLVTHKGKVLLLMRSREPAKGQYWFPGGRVLKGELIRDAALRKAREEVGLECSFESTVSLEETIFPRQGDMPYGIHTVNVCCHVPAGSIENLTLDAAHENYLWVDSEQAEKLNLHEAVRAPLVKCLAYLPSRSTLGSAALWPAGSGC